MVEFPALAVVFLAVLPSVAGVVLSPSGKPLLMRHLYALRHFALLLSLFLFLFPPLLGALAFALGFLLCTQRMDSTRGGSGDVPVHESLVVLDANGVVLHPEALLNLVRAQTLRSERPNPLIEKVHFSLPYSAGSQGACPGLPA